MSGDHNQYQKGKSYLDFECPRCGHCCYVDDDDISQDHVDETVKRRHEWFDCTDDQLIEEVRRRGFVIRDAQIEVPKREWVGLTEDECIGLLPVMPYEYEFDVEALLEYTKIVEAKLKERNHG